MAFVTQKVPKLRVDRHFFSSSNDNAMMKQIQATHAPDGREVDVKPFLHIIEDIFKRAGFGIPGFIQGTQVQFESMEDKGVHWRDIPDVLDLFSYTINKISCEILYMFSGAGDTHATTVAILNVLSSYSWDAKLVLALAAYAVNYGAFWLVLQVYPMNPLAKSVAFLKQMPEILEHTEPLKLKFEVLNKLSKAMLDVTKCIVKFKELPSQYITPDKPGMVTATEALNNLSKAMLDVTKGIVEFKEFPSQYITPDTPGMVTATAQIPTAVYWTIWSIVTCTSQIMGLVGVDHGYIASTTEVWELLILAQKLENIHSHLVKKITLCQQLVRYLTLVDDIETLQIDNMKILKDLIYAKENQLLLFDGSKDVKIDEVLIGKHVLLFITDLEIPTEELQILIEMFNESRKQPSRPERQYQVVWLHVKDDSIDWDKTKKEENFKSLRKNMPWYSLPQPELDPAVIRFIKDVWQFNKNPLLVLLDPQGNVVIPKQSKRKENEIVT